MKNKNFTIVFGVLCDPPSKQLKQQNIKIDKGQGKIVDKITAAVSLLSFRGILSESQKESARKKIVKYISKCIKNGE
jgi:hypothetical protein